MKRAVLLGALFAFVGACADPVDDLAPCSMSNDCLPGYICQEGFCVLGEQKTKVGICEEGGSLSAGTGELIIPEDALDRCEQITFEQASGTLVPEGVVPLSTIFVAAPEDVNIATEIFVELEFSTENLRDGEVPFVYRASSLDSPWLQLPNTTVTGTTARASSLRLGFFVVAVPLRDTPDAGPANDSGLHPDAMMGDAGVAQDTGFDDSGLSPDAGVVDSGVEIMDALPAVPDSGMMMLADSGVMEIPDSGMMSLSDSGMEQIGDSGGLNNSDTGMGGPMQEDGGMGSMPDGGMGSMPDSGNPNQGDSGMGVGMPDGGMGQLPDGGMGVMPDSGGLAMPDSGTGNTFPDSGSGTLLPDSGGGGFGFPDTGTGSMFPDSGTGSFGDTGLGLPDSGGMGGNLPDSGMIIGDGGGGGLADSGMPTGGTGGGGGMPPPGGGGGMPPPGGV